MTRKDKPIGPLTKLGVVVLLTATIVAVAVMFMAMLFFIGPPPA
jgi:hypothetical protein